MALPQYRFPRDNPQDYKGVIEFRVVEITPPTVTGFNSNAITDVKFKKNPDIITK